MYIKLSAWLMLVRVYMYIRDYPFNLPIPFLIFVYVQYIYQLLYVGFIHVQQYNLTQCYHLKLSHVSLNVDLFFNLLLTPY